MTVTSTTRCSIFIFTTVSSAEIFPTWGNSLRSVSGWQGEAGGRRASLSSSLFVCFFLHFPLIPLFYLPSLCFFLYPSPPLPPSSSPPSVSEQHGNTDVIWLEMAPRHISIPLAFSLMTAATVDILLTQRHRVRGRSRSGPSSEKTATLPLHLISVKHHNEWEYPAFTWMPAWRGVARQWAPVGDLDCRARWQTQSCCSLAVWQERVSHSPGCHCLFFCSQINKSWIFHDCLFPLR